MVTAGVFALLSVRAEANDVPIESLPGNVSSIDMDGNSWGSLHGYTYLDGNHRWLGYIGTDFRFVDNGTTFRRSRIRTGLLYKISKKLDIGFIQDLIHNHNPSLTEVRPLLQVRYYLDEIDNKWLVGYRFRLEQRNVEGLDAPIYRVRFRINARRWLYDDKRWYYRGFTELFMNTDHRRDPSQNNFSQLRIFNGLGFTPDGDKTRFEGGYNVRYVGNTLGADRVDHILFMQMYKYF